MLPVHRWVTIFRHDSWSQGTATQQLLVDCIKYEAVQFVREHRDEPFFLYLSHYAVHTTLVGKAQDVAYFSEKAGCVDVPYEQRNRLPEENLLLAVML